MEKKIQITFDSEEQPFMERIWQAWESDKDYLEPEAISHTYGQWVAGDIALLISYEQAQQILANEEEQNEEIPYVAIGNDEIDAGPALGDSILCDKCGERHPIEYGDEVKEDGTKVPSTLLAFYKCGETSYLVGINGKDIRKRR